MSAGAHSPFATHAWVEVDRDENANRIRVRERCACGAERYGCFAKRVDADGRTLWGPVGEWWFTLKAPRGAT